MHKEEGVEMKNTTAVNDVPAADSENFEVKTTAENSRKNVRVKRTPIEIISKIVMIIFIVVCFVYCVSLFIPLIWMLMNSFKGYVEYYIRPSYMFPQEFVWENYSYVLSKLTVTLSTQKGRITYGLGDMLVNSVIWAAVNPIIYVALTTMCAYVIAKYEFRGRNFLFSLGIIVMILPIIGSMGAAMQLKKVLGIYDNMVLTMLTSTTCAFSGTNFLIVYAAFKGIPWAYAESVFMDGGGHFRAFFQVMLPLVSPTLVVLLVLGFIGGWNSYEIFLIWLPSYANLAYGMYYFQSNASLTGATVPQILAGFVVVSIPTAILYLTSQNLIMSKFTIGGLKG